MRCLQFISAEKIRTVSAYILVIIVFFVAFEGPYNIIFVFKSLHRPIAERVHTKYDQQLGWVNIPNIFIKDMYGEGRYLKINSQGFRSNKDFSISIPKNKIRIICSGDSFTLGYGVDNDHTWCQYLSSIDKRLETINMGQGGYGIDQMYLWYLRDGNKFEHNILLFAFIDCDFYRSGKHFLGYGKPFLRLQNDLLVADNIPVPKRSFYVPWLTENIEYLSKLKSFRALRKIYNTLVFNKSTLFAPNRGGSDESIALRVFEDLSRINKLKHSKLVIVYLPHMLDLQSNDSLELRISLRLELAKRGIPFIDLFYDFKKLPVAEARAMFIGQCKYPYSAGHYSEKGNAYVANLLYKELSPFLEF